jgi:hypothetical protein
MNEFMERRRGFLGFVNNSAERPAMFVKSVVWSTASHQQALAKKLAAQREQSWYVIARRSDELPTPR